ncbi:CHAT domain-containing protein [Streptomyces griseosporeus]|uniref:CHAT domain-containing protein n=1 Tax=Streptomyces griseosporeus TaxID=1910 RepID=UPI0036FC4120
MGRDLRVRVVQDPSEGFTALPDERAVGPDVTVCLDVVAGDRIRARLYGPAVPSLYGTEHRVDLTVRPAEVRLASARLVGLWKELLVDHRPMTDEGLPVPGRPERPYASLVDLRAQPQAELRRILEDLASAGSDLLYGTLLGGPDPRVERFAAYLTRALTASGGALRVRFDSELYVPWPMVCLRPEDTAPAETDEESCAALFPRFLGYRHQIEQTGGAYPGLGRRSEPPERPAVSLNRDARLDPKGRTRAAEVAALLSKDTRFVDRTTRAELVRALGDGRLCEQVMYFWCHGHFVSNGFQPARFAVKLTDQTPIDAQTVRERRRRFGDHSPFQPFVLLNACYGGLPEEGEDPSFLGGALIQAGARGVLGPQIEMPQAFAAEYALAFLDHYLRGERTAGAIAHEVARDFADRRHNPLGFAYALHCGMDARLDRATTHSAHADQELVP